MTIQSVNVIMSRLDGCDPSSPIAVFMQADMTPGLDAVFANTVRSQQMIKGLRTGKLVGIYHGLMDKHRIEKELLQAAKDARARSPRVAKDSNKKSLKNA